MDIRKSETHLVVFVGTAPWGRPFLMAGSFVLSKAKEKEIGGGS